MRVPVLTCVSILATSVVVFARAQAAAPEPTLADVLRRAAAYVAEFHVRLSSIVAEETYTQDWYSVGPKGKTFGRREYVNCSEKAQRSLSAYAKPVCNVWPSPGLTRVPPSVLGTV